MSTAKHTPGPWERGICQVTKDFLKGRLTEAVVTKDGVVVCLTGEGDADANLISAAPELLEALQVLRAQCESMASADWRQWEELASPEEFVRWAKSRASHMEVQARAAIAKATGG